MSMYRKPYVSVSEMHGTWCPTFHPLQLFQNFISNSPASLAQQCCEKIVSDSSLSLVGGIELPRTLISRLLATALSAGRYLTTQSLVPFWPEDTLTLHKVLPQLLSNPMLLGNHHQQQLAQQKAVFVTTTLVTKWLSLIDDETDKTSVNTFHKNGCKIKTLDVSGFPLSAEIFWELRKRQEHTLLGQVQRNIYTVKISRDAMNVRNPFYEGASNRIKNSIIKLEVVYLTTSVNSRRTLQLLHPTHLVGLDLSMTNLGNNGVITFLPAITKCVNLACLDLSKNNIQLRQSSFQSSDALSSLNYTIVNLPRLRRLNLSNNRLSGSLASCLDASLPLEYLNLNACCLEPRDMTHLPISLIHLDLSENNVSTLPSNLKNIKDLAILELENCKISCHEIGAVVNFLISFPKLWMVSLAWNSWGAVAGMALERLLTSEQIKYLILSSRNGHAGTDMQDLELLKQVADARRKTLVWRGYMLDDQYVGFFDAYRVPRRVYLIEGE